MIWYLIWYNIVKIISLYFSWIAAFLIKVAQNLWFCSFYTTYSISTNFLKYTSFKKFFIQKSTIPFLLLIIAVLANYSLQCSILASITWLKILSPWLSLVPLTISSLLANLLSAIYLLVSLAVNPFWYYPSTQISYFSCVLFI